MNVILTILLSLPSYSLGDMAKRSTDVVRADAFLADAGLMATVRETYRGSLVAGQEIFVHAWNGEGYSSIHSGPQIFFLKNCDGQYQISGQNSGAYQLIDGSIFSFAQEGPHSMREENLKSYLEKVYPFETMREPCINKHD